MSLVEVNDNNENKNKNPSNDQIFEGYDFVGHCHIKNKNTNVKDDI